MTTQSILWRSIHWPGHEACCLFSQNAEWHLEGTAVFSHVHQPCRLSYLVVCEENWNTLRARISGWVGDTVVDIDLVVDPKQRWRLNGIEQPPVAGCIDLDLNFSPSTNLLPIRRLNLPVGQEALVTAAWLKFPGFMERIIDQTEKGFPDHDENVAVHLAFSERRKSSKKERNTDKTELGECCYEEPRFAKRRSADF